MAKRMNIILEDETELTIKRSTKPGERSRFINRAVQYYAATHSPAALRERLKRAALRDRDLADEIARDWEPLGVLHMEQAVQWPEEIADASDSPLQRDPAKQVVAELTNQRCFGEGASQQ